jgi:hypothetical protein
MAHSFGTDTHQRAPRVLCPLSIAPGRRAGIALYGLIEAREHDVIGTQTGADVIAVNTATGARKWIARSDAHPDAQITGSVVALSETAGKVLMKIWPPRAGP